MRLAAGMLSKDFRKWVVIAFLIACPFGCMIMARWLNSFAYNSGISPYSFLFTGLIVIAIGLLTVGVHSEPP